MRNKGMVLCLAAILCIPGRTRGQEYDFEIPEIEERNLELSGNLDGKWGLLGSRKDSPFYPLQNLSATADNYLSQYRLDFSLSGVLLIPEAEADTRFAPASQIGMALKLYLLIRDVDIELMTLYRKGQARRYGVDFAANLRTHLEVHGELDYAVDEDTYRILDGYPVQNRRSGFSYLLGMRYLTTTNTTLVSTITAVTE